ncbi:ABC transporter ATP-binding protein [Lutimaribacter marinistellae]|uniref:ABC transporter ATP-binding protein n=1 Tax=Lutimaribacter marinistellae TaxID=1820329 RepID=A0ABV7TEZ5_9RHOB
MTIAHLLQDFETDPLNADKVHLMSEEALEEHRLKAFDQGYSAGWDDAAAAQADQKTDVAAALARTLEDASFTYQEALAQLSAALDPMFKRLVDTVLPGALKDGYGMHLVEQLHEMARGQTSQPALVVVPNGAGAILKPLLEREFAMPVQIVEEASLPPGQASLRIGNAERAVDCDALMAALATALESFTYHAKEAAQNV